MRRDSIFYQLFKQVPGLLFELVDTPPTAANRYQFESVEVKETAFRIDGVFLPPVDVTPKVVFFAEAQFQKDENLYHRFFSELFVFLYRNSIRYDNWRGVLIFGSRSLEPSNSDIHQALLDSIQVQRIYLDELSELQPQPLGLGLMVLTIAAEDRAIQAAQHLIEQAQQELDEAFSQRAIIDLVITIMVYKFTQLSREEIEAMLGLSLEESRVYRDAREEGRIQGQQEGRQEGELAIVLRQLNRRVGQLTPELRTQVQALSLIQLEALGEALLDFRMIADLITWLQAQP
jgi:predicted transposase/invertase (TIGR01784 family)